jgi:hypothetical protein
MRITSVLAVAVLAASTPALAQAPSLSNQIPAGVAAGGGDVVLGNGCPCTLGTPEGEANCGLPTDTVNGGCNSAPPIYTPISPGESYCGTAEWNVSVPNFRDTDWYEYVPAADETVVWRVDAGFPAAVFVIDGSTGCPASLILGLDTTTGCGDVGELQVDLTAGTPYWFFVAPDFGGPPLACGAEYTASLNRLALIQEIPTLSRVGLGAIALLLVGAAALVLRRRSRRAA